MSDRAIEKSLKDIREAQAIANVCIEDIPPSTRTAWGSNIEQAKERLKPLRESYKDLVLGSTLAIFVTGDPIKAREFAVLAEEEGGTITLDARALWDRLSARVDVALGRERVFTASYIPLFIQGIKEVAGELGLNNMLAPQLRDTPIVPTTDDLVAFVREIVREAVGDEMNRLYLANILTDGAIAQGFDGTVAPVVIINATPNEIMGLSCMFATVGTQVNVSEDTEITKEGVIKAFNQAKKSKAVKGQRAAKGKGESEDE